MFPVAVFLLELTCNAMDYHSNYIIIMSKHSLNMQPHNYITQILITVFLIKGWKLGDNHFFTTESIQETKL